ncbi:uncharacterized protein FOMMEDRAFT_156199 [Fomitiporia mediterranea MF3/22]|uniref:uncharacterized protein n=1 Tax=Fomitiporia mediterranea (strain MF3/22) TaxID=694068 RepID=UPI00044084EE|nr:uncharacterized protein FOMMEDRAFT_156199 [Fomitiporia mediterranea MF3/22]EJD02842.1 hypothetical protein FOMMEDRAFT_156199 [Fomitiporia mediterranea MF3/22]
MFTIRPFAEYDISSNRLQARQRRDWNFKLSSIRVCIEHAFGRLKGRFPLLRRLSGKTMKVCWRTIEACMILHNILEELGDDPSTIEGFNGEEDIDEANENEQAENVLRIDNNGGDFDIDGMGEGDFYDRAEENELTFCEGDRITDIEAASEDWSQGRDAHGNVGLFPANYVEVQDTPLPFFSIPDFIGSVSPNVTDDTPIDLVFVDFIESQLIGILTRYVEHQRGKVSWLSHLHVILNSLCK